MTYGYYADRIGEPNDINYLPLRIESEGWNSVIEFPLNEKIERLCKSCDLKISKRDSTTAFVMDVFASQLLGAFEKLQELNPKLYFDELEFKQIIEQAGKKGYIHPDSSWQTRIKVKYSYDTFAKQANASGEKALELAYYFLKKGDDSQCLTWLCKAYDIFDNEQALIKYQNSFALFFEKIQTIDTILLFDDSREMLFHLMLRSRAITQLTIHGEETGFTSTRLQNIAELIESANPIEKITLVGRNEKIEAKWWCRLFDNLKEKTSLKEMSFTNIALNDESVNLLLDVAKNLKLNWNNENPLNTPKQICEFIQNRNVSTCDFDE